ncbi:hypothetical protein ANCDUO_10078 [Ancylostoma duodenale]|uniref:Uncharacterized protein n=1 Tax=Ancylostoma duodenale TaxID=51022 RepID=A0A0C2GET1_9BILA|nr:hypothetical protein ANCDUO_10078 [Ancylostoma duodenale]
MERSADEEEDEDITEETTVETTTVAKMALLVVIRLIDVTYAFQKTCKAFDVCYGDEDCPGGQCLGAFVGKCNCNACLDFWL